MIIRVGLIGILAIVFGVLALYAGLTSGLSEKRELQKLEEEGRLQDVLDDFATARSFLDDRVRFGERYIFRPKMITPIYYRDIATVKYTSSVEHGTTDYRVFHVSVGTGDIPTTALYSVPFQHPEEAEMMIAIIRMHNPSVVVK